MAERVDDRAAQRGLARAGFPRQQQQALAAAQARQQLFVGPPMRRAEEEESRVGRQRERLLAQAVERLVERFAKRGRRRGRLHKRDYTGEISAITSRCPAAAALTRGFC